MQLPDSPWKSLSVSYRDPKRKSMVLSHPYMEDHVVLPTRSTVRIATRQNTQEVTYIAVVVMRTAAYQEMMENTESPQPTLQDILEFKGYKMTLSDVAWHLPLSPRRSTKIIQKQFLECNLYVIITKGIRKQFVLCNSIFSS